MVAAHGKRGSRQDMPREGRRGWSVAVWRLGSLFSVCERPREWWRERKVERERERERETESVCVLPPLPLCAFCLFRVVQVSACRDLEEVTHTFFFLAFAAVARTLHAQ